MRRRGFRLTFLGLWAGAACSPEILGGICQRTTKKSIRSGGLGFLGGREGYTPLPRTPIFLGGSLNAPLFPSPRDQRAPALWISSTYLFSFLTSDSTGLTRVPFNRPIHQRQIFAPQTAGCALDFQGGRFACK